MGFTIQTAKNLIKIKRLIPLILIILLIIFSQSTSALNNNSVPVNINCGSLGGESALLAKFDGTGNTAVQAIYDQAESGSHYIIYYTPNWSATNWLVLAVSTDTGSKPFRWLNGNSTYYAIGASAGNSANQVRIDLGSNTYNTYTGTTGDLQRTSSSSTHTTICAGSLPDPFTDESIDFNPTLQASLTNIMPIPDQCDNIDDHQYTVPDGYVQIGTSCYEEGTLYDNILIQASQVKIAYDWNRDPYEPVTGHTNDRCADTLQEFLLDSDYFNRLDDHFGDSYSNWNEWRTEYLNIRDNNLGGSGILVDINEEVGTWRVILLVWEGNPTIDWYPIGHATYPDGRAILNAGSFDMHAMTINPQCSIFNIDDPPPNLSPNYSNPSSGDYVIGGTTSTFTVNAVSDTLTRHIMMLNGTFNPNYPATYGGIEIGDRVLGVVDRVYADFDLYTNGTNIRADYLGTEFDDTKCVVLQWQWASADDPLNISTDYTRIGQEFSTLLPDVGTYRLNVTWTWRAFDLSAVGLNDTDQPYCFGKNAEIVSLYEQGKLPFNTGKIFPVDLLNNEYFGYSPDRVCNIDDEMGIGFNNPTMLCEYDVTWDIEDCSIYSFVTEMDERFPCEIENFFRRLWNMMIRFFVPNPYKLTSKVQALSESATIGGNVGQIPVQLFTATYNASVTATPDCDFVANGATFDFCVVNDINSDIFNLIKFVINFSLMFSFAYAVWRFITSVFRSDG